MNEKLLIIDGSALLSTAYYGTLPDEIKYAKNHDNDFYYYGKILHSNSGKYTNGVFSVMNRIEKIIEEQKPTHMAVTFDITRDTFRRKLYPEYKGNRKETPEPLKQQREYLPQMLMEMGIMSFASNDFEGDDLIGSLAEKFRQVIPVYIMSNDHDMTQLVKPGTQLWLTCHTQEKADTMYLDYTQGANDFSLSALNLPDAVFPYGRNTVKWDMGVYPEQVPDLKGLAGDSSDNIPGVKGISQKNAAILLSKYGTIENLFSVVKNTDKEILKAEWKNELGFKVSPINKLLDPNAETNALLSKQLATIITGLDFPISLEHLRLNINETNRQKWYNELGFKSILMKKPKLCA